MRRRCFARCAFIVGTVERHGFPHDFVGDLRLPFRGLGCVPRLFGPVGGCLRRFVCGLAFDFQRFGDCLGGLGGGFGVLDRFG